MSQNASQIFEPSDSALDRLCQQLADNAGVPQSENQWPASSLQLCGQSGVFAWFIDKLYGGQGWNSRQITEGYLALSKACLKTTFIITQRTSATDRIQTSHNEQLKADLLPDLAAGRTSTTVGISHLTTSRQHTQPAMRARRVEGGFVVEGFSPWVTGSPHADTILMGAVLPDAKQILFIGRRNQIEEQIAAQPGFQSAPPQQLMALTGSQTGAVHVSDLFVPDSDIVNGPVGNVIKVAAGAMTGGLQTSTLAIGHASAAVQFICNEAEKRADLQATAAEFSAQLAEARSQLLARADGQDVCSQELRKTANSLVLRATQAALVAAKGAGYVDGHKVGRWCREAMFFLVWSCPQPVSQASLCELAGVESF